MIRVARPPILEEIDLDHHAVIEASAGTGKTYTLEHLIVELLLGRGVLLEQILVVTFTDKATREMRDRVRKKLRSIAEASDDPSAERAWTIDAAAQRRLNDALAGFDRAPISTIHAFCQRILTESAFDCARLLTQEQIESREAFGEAYREELRHALAPGSSLVPVIERALSVNQPQRVEDALYRWYAERGEPEPRFDREKASAALMGLPAPSDLAPDAAIRRILERDLDRNPKREIPRILSTLAPIVAKIRSGASLYDLLPELWDWASKTAPGDEDQLGYLRKHLARAALRARTLTPLADRIEQLGRSAGEPLSVLVSELLPRIALRLSGRKSERGHFDFDDMLEMLRDALYAPGSDRLVAELRRRYRVAMVDEFQDTDRVQWDIFRRIFFESSEHRLIVIGDPKQAIYGFRNADVYTYRAACDEIRRSGGRVVPLTVSYRSTPRLVAATNRLLEGGFFTGLNAYPHPVRAARTEAVLLDREGNEAAPIVLMHAVGSPELRADLARASLAEKIASEIQYIQKAKLLVGDRSALRPIEPSDVHVLCRTRSEADLIGAALARARVPYAFYKQEGLFQTAAARAFYVLLRALEEPDDRARRLDAWLTPFFAVPIERLADCREVAGDHPLAMTLVRWRALAEAQHWPELLRAVLEESGLLRRELFAASSERALTDYQHIAEIMLEETHRGRRSLPELIARLSAFIDGRELPVGESGNVHRLESERRAVQVLTMHKAKGLEAEIVFLFGGLSEPLPDTLAPRVFHDASGRRVAWLGAVPEQMQEQLRRENREEAQRLLYVALTRARSRLYLPYFGPPPPGAPVESGLVYELQVDERSERPQLSFGFGGEEDEQVSDFDLKRLDGAYRVVNDRLRDLVWNGGLDRELFERVVVPVRSTARNAMQARLSLVGFAPSQDLLRPAEAFEDAPFSRLRAQHAGVDITSYTRMKSAAGGYRAPDDIEERAAVDAIAGDEEALPGGAAAGVFVHEVLELVDFAAIRALADADALLAQSRPIFEDAARRNGISQEYLRAAARLVFAALRTPIVLGTPVPDGLCAIDRRVAEMPFLHPIPERDHPTLQDPPPGGDALVIERGFVRGVIDLVLEHEGRYYVLDWKTDRLASYQSDALWDHVERNYAVQARLYTIGVVRALSIHDRADYDARFGGLVYLFVRGMGDGHGVWSSRPSWDEVLEWERALREDAPWGYPLPPRRAL